MHRSGTTFGGAYAAFGRALTVNLIHLQDVGLEHTRATGRSSRSVDRPLPYAVPVLLAVLVILARQ